MLQGSRLLNPYSSRIPVREWLMGKSDTTPASGDLVRTRIREAAISAQRQNKYDRRAGSFNKRGPVFFRFIFDFDIDITIPKWQRARARK